MTSRTSLAKTQALMKLSPTERTALILRTNRNTRVDKPSQAQQDRTAAIAGRWNANAKDV